MPKSAPRLLYSRRRPGCHSLFGWMGLRAGLDRNGKTRLHWNSIPGPTSPYRVPLRTALYRPTLQSGRGMMREHLCCDTERRNRSVRHASCTTFTTNPTRIALAASTGLHGERLASIRRSCKNISQHNYPRLNLSGS